MNHQNSIPIVKMRRDPANRSWVCIVVPQCDPGGSLNPERSPYKGRNIHWSVYDPDGKVAGYGYVSSFKGANDATLRCCKRKWAKAVKVINDTTISVVVLAQAQDILKGQATYDASGSGCQTGKIAAIKFVRKMTGLGLKPAKQVVDQMEGRYG